MKNVLRKSVLVLGYSLSAVLVIGSLVFAVLYGNKLIAMSHESSQGEQDAWMMITLFFIVPLLSGFGMIEGLKSLND